MLCDWKSFLCHFGRSIQILARRISLPVRFVGVVSSLNITPKQKIIKKTKNINVLSSEQKTYTISPNIKSSPIIFCVIEIGEMSGSPERKMKP
jgi:hypothetical protein